MANTALNGVDLLVHGVFFLVNAYSSVSVFSLVYFVVRTQLIMHLTDYMRVHQRLVLSATLLSGL